MEFQESSSVPVSLATIIHKFGVSVDFLWKFRAESVFRCDYKASKLVEPNRDEARALPETARPAGGCISVLAQGVRGPSGGTQTVHQ